MQMSSRSFSPFLSRTSDHLCKIAPPKERIAVLQLSGKKDIKEQVKVLLHMLLVFRLIVTLEELQRSSVQITDALYKSGLYGSGKQQKLWKKSIISSLTQSLKLNFVVTENGPHYLHGGGSVILWSCFSSAWTEKLMRRWMDLNQDNTGGKPARSCRDAELGGGSPPSRKPAWTFDVKCEKVQWFWKLFQGTLRIIF